MFYLIFALIVTMAQAQLDEQARQHNTFFIDLHGEITVKIWKKGREGIFVKLMKPGTSQSLTLPLGVCKNLTRCS